VSSRTTFILLVREDTNQGVRISKLHWLPDCSENPFCEERTKRLQRKAGTTVDVCIGDNSPNYFNRSLKSRSFSFNVSFAGLTLPSLSKREGSYFINLSAIFK